MTSEAISLARPRKKIKAEVEIRKELAILRLERNQGVAVVPLQELCNIAQRYNLLLVNYDCEERE